MIITDTIAAIATATGRGGVGIVRVSGAKARHVAENLLSINLQPRHAHYCDFKNSAGEVLDQGVDRFGPSFAAVVDASKVWVNGDGAGRDSGIGPDDEVAVLPPVSSG